MINRLACQVLMGCILWIVLLLNGCGGSQSTITVASPQASGSIQVAVTWPDLLLVPALVPNASNSIVIQVKSSTGKIVGTTRIVRPNTQGEIDGIFAGAYTVIATAYPTADGTGSAQAVGISSSTVTPLSTTHVSLTMTSTIDHITVTPSNISLSLNSKGEVAATAYDAANQIILTVPNDWTWAIDTPTIGSLEANTSSSSGNAQTTITGVGVGNATITVTEKDTGKATTCALAVTEISNVPSYTITDLGGIGVSAINDNGDVVGGTDITGTGGGAVYVPFGGQQQNITPGASSAVASHINNLGQIVGIADKVAFVAQGASITTYLPKLSGFDVGDAKAINISGTIVGVCNSYVGTPLPQAFIYDVNGLRQLPGLPDGDTRALDINDIGTIVGCTHNQACEWKSETLTLLPTIAGYEGGSATAVNNVGQVVGYCWNPSTGVMHSWLYDPSTGIKDISPSLSYQSSYQSIPYAINDSGEIVGTQLADGKQKAILWYKGNSFNLDTLIPLNTGWELQTATGVNTHGAICGTGYLNGQYHSFMLFPKQ